MNERKGIDLSVAEAKGRIEAMDERHDEERIRSTAERLRLMHYDPGLNERDDDFLSIRKDGALRRIDRIASLPAEEQDRIARISYFVNQYALLVRLRDDDGEAWDEVEELYGEE